MESGHEPISVLLAEDHALVREGTRQMLERHDVITVVGEAVDGEMAIEMSRDLRPDVLVLDMSLPIVNGVEVTRAVRAAPEPPRVLILSAYDDHDYASAGLRAGATGYLLKTASSEDLTAAIVAVARGEVVLHPAIAAKVLDAHPDHRHEHVMTLSDRELQVLSHAARGLRTSDIASELSVSTRTVESHFTSIYNKLGVTNRTAAVLHAASQGWVTIDHDD